MNPTIQGIHHVTAIAGDPQRNIDFYTNILGLRLVKLTVNYDDPRSYHVYYGDGLGTPGTLLTFFLWPGASRGRQGVGQAALSALAIPQDAIGYWIERLISFGVSFEGPRRRFGEQVLSFRDPDGLQLELVASLDARRRPVWQAGPLPAERAVRGLHSVTLWEEDGRATTQLLEQMGFRPVGEAEHTTRYRAGEGLPSMLVDLRSAPGFWQATTAVGSVHHIAFRTPDAQQQRDWQARFVGAGLAVSEVRDRRYFQSIYFREPGGVLFEIATDGPGFTVDEPVEDLGTRLMLPEWYEQHRQMLTASLPPLYLPGSFEEIEQ